jgi:hypothetical protein
MLDELSACPPGPALDLPWACPWPLPPVVWDVGLLLGILMVVCSWPCLVALVGGIVGLGCAGGFVAWYFNGRLFLAVPRGPGGWDCWFGMWVCCLVF